ncbi:MAG: DUF6266 family protein [Marinifilaceae bacterium]
MAKAPKGITSDFSGRVGNVVGYKIKGTQYMRGFPDHYNYERTKEGDARHEKFKAVSKFLKTIKSSIIKPSWDKHANNNIGRNLFTSVNYEAFTEDGRIGDFSKLILTLGDIPLPENIKISANNIDMEITWDFDRRSSLGDPDDVAKLCYFFKNDDFCDVYYKTLGKREDKLGFCVLDFVNDSVDNQFAFYLYFENYNCTALSESIYFELDL